MHVRCAWSRLIGRVPYEHPWMLGYIDRPLVVDVSKTETLLDWHCTPGKDVCSRIPIILANRKARAETWESRNVLRNEARYAYYADDAT